MTETCGTERLLSLLLRSAEENYPQSPRNSLDPLHLMPVTSSNSYLVCEREREDQHLAIQFPFSLILHVGHLDFDGHWTLQNRTWPLYLGNPSPSGTMLSYS